MANLSSHKDPGKIQYLLSPLKCRRLRRKTPGESTKYIIDSDHKAIAL